MKNDSWMESIATLAILLLVMVGVWKPQIDNFKLELSLESANAKIAQQQQIIDANNIEIDDKADLVVYLSQQLDTEEKGNQYMLAQGLAASIWSEFQKNGIHDDFNNQAVLRFHEKQYIIDMNTMRFENGVLYVTVKPLTEDVSFVPMVMPYIAGTKSYVLSNKGEIVNGNILYSAVFTENSAVFEIFWNDL